MLVRDLSGRPLFHLDGDTARDENGKPVAMRTGDDAQALTLADRAAHWMSGKPVLMDLGPADVAAQATQAAFHIPAGECIADQVSEVRYVTHDRGVWYIQNIADAVKLVIASGGGDAQPAELNPGFTKTAFVTNGYALAAKLPRDVAQNADFDVEQAALYRLVEGLRLAREYRVAQLLTTPANWASANRIAASANWNGGAGANPLTDLFNALSASALPSHTLIMPENAARYFFGGAQTQVRDYVQAGGQLPGVLFARAKLTNAGATSYVWSPSNPTNIALVRSPDVMPSSVTLRWLGASPDGETKSGMLVRKFFDPQSKCDWLVAAHNDIEILVSNQIGAVITGALT